MISRYLGRMGWDWVILDMQHGCPNTETAYECMHTLRTAGTTPMVRTSVGAPSEVQRALDLGARGVVVPMVNSVGRSPRDGPGRQVSAAGLPLDGRRRGLALWRRLSRAGQRRDAAAGASRAHRLGQRRSKQIMATPGVDGCFIGPTDLALSMGLPRTDYEHHPDHRAAIARTLAACHAHGKLACCNTYSMDDVAGKDRRRASTASRSSPKPICS